MKIFKILILALCVATLAASDMFAQNVSTSQNTEKHWNAALSNAVLFKKMDNVQLEINRKVMRTWLGLYFQVTNYVLEHPSDGHAADYLPKNGFMPQGRAWQLGGQIAWHLLSPDKKFDLWIKYRAGLNHSRRCNNSGAYWYWNEAKEKEYYTVDEKQYKKFVNMEMSLGIGLSRKISDNFSVFIEPALNCQFFAQNYRTRQNDVMIHAFFPIHYGVNLAF